MPRFYDRDGDDGIEYWYERDGQNFRLHNDNFLANLHEVLDDELNIQETADAVYDRVCVEDPEDGEFWLHWRAEHTQDEWQKLEMIARRCGSLLIRQTALEQLVTHFNARFASEVISGELFVPDDWESSDGKA